MGVYKISDILEVKYIIVSCKNAVKDKQPDLFYRWGRHNLANVTKGS